eukprot:2505539-Prymnesium_polylepis.1
MAFQSEPAQRTELVATAHLHPSMRAERRAVRRAARWAARRAARWWRPRASRPPTAQSDNTRVDREV